MKKAFTGCLIPGILAGCINGLLGTGGGMVLVPLLRKWGGLAEEEVFPASVAIILPICVVSLWLCLPESGLKADTALPYLLGAAAGGLAAGRFGAGIPVKWLHRGLCVLILWGGVRYLC